ncbi:uncharacterized protein LOC6531586 [Drosophila yakuba]|uniref:Uncharacterized protein, isoform A n=1 Tax=Drosophila yakuba TaxID=7245 RepID=B4P7F1_DROYA|nr:uncharacterized protein LOC6531586 [Drosophila yakuba]XP_015051425.1 uncharacterized protein LOC6531586 [Drosophila yakuba]EDW92096.1 uncharacterized protein Dyak_GE11696, isoform A [Drosophila yakuba]KRK00317.1 uncharacterized protein Dyak_GE11696, isoform B [Drosophila yakuba]
MHLSPGQLKVVLILALLQELQVKPQREVFQELFEKDLRLCPNCFFGQRELCGEIFQKIAEPSDWSKLLKAISLLVDRRVIYFLRFKDQDQVVAKRKIIDAQNQQIKDVKKAFYELGERPGGFHLCRTPSRKPRFVSYLEQRGHASASVWFYMMHYVSPLLMQELYLQGFPVPTTYASCGLTHFQSYAGRTLTNYFEGEEDLRVELALQLMQLSLKLTFGFSDFRIMLTDFTGDNFAYDEHTKKVYLIDLDSVVLVDASSATGQAEKYEPLPGEGFTFDVSAFCSGHQLDANIYQACLLLRDYLLKNLNNERLQLLLEQCVACQDDFCDMRFQHAYDLIKMLDSKN